MPINCPINSAGRGMILRVLPSTIPSTEELLQPCYLDFFSKACYYSIISDKTTYLPVVNYILSFSSHPPHNDEIELSTTLRMNLKHHKEYQMVGLQKPANENVIFEFGCSTEAGGSG